MGVIGFLLFVIVVGIICGLCTLPGAPLPAEFKRFIPVIGIVLCVVVLLYLMLGGGHDIAIPRLR